jgi:copper resistance protein B
MRALLTLLALAAAPAAAQDHGAHHVRTFTMLRGEVDYARSHGEGLASWDADAWAGGDEAKLWLKSEGEIAGGDTEQAEAQALYSRNIGTFFDLQAGVRHDFAGRDTTHLAVGVQGLAPYLMETDVAAFVSHRGDVSLRAEQTVDLLITQRFAVEPHVEVNLQLQDVPEQRLGSGFTDVEAGLQARYEISRKFAPYLDAVYERRLGATRRLARAAGEPGGGWSLRAGLRFWF